MSTCCILRGRLLIFLAIFIGTIYLKNSKQWGGGIMYGYEYFSHVSLTRFKF